MTDAGLVHLSKLRELQFLSLDGTQVTDQGLAQLKGLRGPEVAETHRDQRDRRWSGKPPCLPARVRTLR